MDLLSCCMSDLGAHTALRQRPNNVPRPGELRHSVRLPQSPSPADPLLLTCTVRVEQGVDVRSENEASPFHGCSFQYYNPLALCSFSLLEDVMPAGALTLGYPPNEALCNVGVPRFVVLVLLIPYHTSKTTVLRPSALPNKATNDRTPCDGACSCHPLATSLFLLGATLS